MIRSDFTREERILAKYEDYIGAVSHKAWSRYGRVFRLDEEDFRQEGRLALVLALRRLDWDSYSSRQIDNFLKNRIWGSMVDFVRNMDGSRSTQWRKYKHSVNVDLGFEHSIEEDHALASGDYPVLEMLELAARASMAMEGMGERDRQIVMLAIQGYDNVQIAGMVGGGNLYGSRSVGPSRVSQVLSSSGLFQYGGKDSYGRGKRIKDDVSRGTEYNRRSAAKKKAL